MTISSLIFIGFSIIIESNFLIRVSCLLLIVSLCSGKPKFCLTESSLFSFKFSKDCRGEDLNLLRLKITGNLLSRSRLSPTNVCSVLNDKVSVPTETFLVGLSSFIDISLSSRIIENTSEYKSLPWTGILTYLYIKLKKDIGQR
eukprot:NODE_138_length_16264_cov_1.140860.p12 type:complete len:144 gc:universal NODE_138_length_16264_cov_1.140860:6881-6450(-)